MDRPLRATLVILALALSFGCRLVQLDRAGRSPLLPLTAAPDAVSLEVFSAPASLDETQTTELWNEVDEQALPADLRERLAQNGLRAGIVGPTVPAGLANLLKLTDERISTEERAKMPVQAEEGVRLLVIQPRPGERRDLVTAQTVDELALLERHNREVEGRTYYKAEPRLNLRIASVSAGRLQLELTPELHHGDFKNRVTGSEGMMTWKQERQKRTFDELKLNATLAQGQMLVVSCRSDRPGSVGHHFFAQSDEGKTVQKFYVLRMAQAHPDRSFVPEETQAPPLTSDEQP
ncbi:MAG TPA: hypothetical protein VGJ16_08060 [Pirellulales bacterium]|jgi:hypothetical protein